MKAKIIVMVVWYLVATSVSAEQCTKNFPYHVITSDGTLGLYQGLGNAWWYPCSVSYERNGVSPEACKSALATYLAAKEQGRDITLFFSGTCAALNGTSNNDIGFQWFGVYW